MINKCLHIFIMIIVLFSSCSKTSTDSFHKIENFCGIGDVLIYQVGNPTEKPNKHFIVVIYFWGDNFKVLLNQQEIYYEQVDEETADYETTFEIEATDSDHVFIIFDNGKCLNFSIDDKFHIYEIYDNLNGNYRVNMKNRF